MNEVELFNRLARKVRPAYTEYVPIETLDIPFEETGLDSMDGLMMTIHLSDIYGVADELTKEFTFTTPAELLAFMKEHKTKTPATLEEALENVQ